MDLRHVCHLVVEALNLAGGNLLGEDAGAVKACVAFIGEDSGVVQMIVDSREYEVIVGERKRRNVHPTIRLLVEDPGEE